MKSEPFAVASGERYDASCRVNRKPGNATRRYHRTVVMRQVDPGAIELVPSSLTLRVVMPEVDPTLPRYGTDFIDTANGDARG